MTITTTTGSKGVQSTLMQLSATALKTQGQARSKYPCNEIKCGKSKEVKDNSNPERMRSPPLSLPYNESLWLHHHAPATEKNKSGRDFGKINHEGEGSESKSHLKRHQMCLMSGSQHPSRMRFSKVRDITPSLLQHQGGQGDILVTATRGVIKLWKG